MELLYIVKFSTTERRAWSDPSMNLPRPLLVVYLVAVQRVYLTLDQSVFNLRLCRSRSPQISTTVVRDDFRGADQSIPLYLKIALTTVSQATVAKYSSSVFSVPTT